MKHFKVAYYSFSETRLRALRNSLWRHFIFRARNTLRHHREKAENTCDIWLVEIARGLLLTFFIMNGRSLEAVSERYLYKISVKPWKKPQEVVVKILMFIARAIFCLISARAYVARMLSFAHKEVAKKSQIDFLSPIYSKTDRITHSKKLKNQFIVVSFTCRQNISKICKRDF